MKLLAAILIIAVLALGCASEDITLRNPKTGQTATCPGGNYEHGLIAWRTKLNQTAKDLQMRCLDDYQRQGYERAPG
jgi:hypothetical protein